MAADIEQVFEEWRNRQKCPARIRLQNDRRRLISRALRDGHTPDDLCTLIRYAHEGAGYWPGWMRGENPQGRSYLDLKHLLVIKDGRLSKRIDEARTFYAPPPSHEEPGARVVNAEEMMRGHTPFTLIQADPTLLPAPQQSLLSIWHQPEVS